MWCVWSNSTALLRQAACSARQLLNSGDTTGYTYAPICELRRCSTVLPAFFSTVSRLLMFLRTSVSLRIYLMLDKGR